MSRDVRVARQETYGLGDDFELGHDCYGWIDYLIGTESCEDMRSPARTLTIIHSTRGYILDPPSTWIDPLGVVGASAEAFSETKTGIITSDMSVRARKERQVNALTIRKRQRCPLHSGM